MNTGKQYTQKGRIKPRMIDGISLSDAIRTKAKVLRSSGVKVKFNISKMTSKQKRGFNGELDLMLTK